jgi:PAS domain S-box-containing protein
MIVVYGVSLFLPIEFGLKILLFLAILFLAPISTPPVTKIVTFAAIVFNLVSMKVHGAFEHQAGVVDAIISSTSLIIAGMLCVVFQLMSSAEKHSRIKAETLAKLSDFMRKSQNLDKLMEYAAELVGTTLDTDRALFIPKLDEYDEAKRIIRRGWSRDGVESLLGAVIPPPDQHPMIMQPEVWSIPDPASNPAIPRFLIERFHVKSMAGASISINGVNGGMLELHECRRQRRWSAEELQLLKAVADQISIALAEENLSKRLAEQSAMLDTIFGNAPTGIIIVDKDLKITYINSYASRFTGMQSEEYIGKYVIGSCDADREKQREIYEKALSGIVTRGQDLRVHVGSPKTERHLKISYFPICASDKTIGSVGVLFEDFTELQNKQDALSLALNREIKVNSILQRSLEPITPSKLSSIELGFVYKPVSEERGVGGDIMDVFPLENNRFAIIIGDVSGHGVEAAAQTSFLRNMIRAYAYSDDPPEMVLGKLSQALSKLLDFDSLVSLFVGVLNPKSGVLEYASAGQEPPIIVRGCGEQFELLYPTGLILGVDSEQVYTRQQIVFGKTDMIVMLTDGLVEARVGESGELLGASIFYDCLRAGLSKEGTLQMQAEDVWSQITRIVGRHTLADDAALLLLRPKAP